MVRKVTAVEVNYDKIKDSGIEVGTSEWFEWLESNKSFHYSCSQGHFTANKNSKGYWYAQRRSEARLLQHYMGQSQKLTLENLKEAASKLSLAVIDNRPHNRLVKVLEEQSCKSCMTEEERLQHSSKGELIELVTHLKNKLHDYKTVEDTSSQTKEEIAILKAENEALKEQMSYLLDERGRYLELEQKFKSAKRYKLHGKEVIQTESFEAWLQAHCPDHAQSGSLQPD